MIFMIGLTLAAVGALLGLAVSMSESLIVPLFGYRLRDWLRHWRDRVEAAAAALAWVGLTLMLISLVLLIWQHLPRMLP